MAQGARGGVYAYNLVGIQMDAHLGIRQVKGFELLRIVPAQVAQKAGIADADVTLGQDEAIAIRPCGIVLLDIHVLVIEHRQDIHRAQAASDMAAARHEGGIQGCVPELIGLRLQVKPLLLC